MLQFRVIDFRDQKMVEYMHLKNQLIQILRIKHFQQTIQQYLITQNYKQVIDSIYNNSKINLPPVLSQVLPKDGLNKNCLVLKKIDLIRL